MRRQKQLPFGLQELRAGDFLKQVEVFFDRVLSLSAFPDKTIRKELEQLKVFAIHLRITMEVRLSCRSLYVPRRPANTLASFSMYSMTSIIKNIAPTECYAAWALDLVADHLKAFAEQAYKSIHPVPLP